MESTPAPGTKAIWISWERHRRTRELSRVLGTDLFEITSPLPRILKYAGLLLRTTVCVVRHRPAFLVVQCPSVVLGLWVGILKRIFQYTLVADLHTQAVIHSSPLCRALLALVRRPVDLCLVSNPGLQVLVEQTGGRALVLPDKVPRLRAEDALQAAASAPQVLFVCTYARDEPYREVIEAARALGPGVTMYVTGDSRNADPRLRPPSSVRLTGFLPEAEYVRLLGAVDVVIDLTSLDDCLVCGAYEAVALEKPLVTSDTPALRDYFRLGTVHTKHDTQSLAEAILYALEHRHRLGTEMKALKLELASTWDRQLDSVRRALRLGDQIVP